MKTKLILIALLALVFLALPVQAITLVPQVTKWEVTDLGGMRGPIILSTLADTTVGALTYVGPFDIGDCWYSTDTVMTTSIVQAKLGFLSIHTTLTGHVVSVCSLHVVLTATKKAPDAAAWGAGSVITGSDFILGVPLVATVGGLSLGTAGAQLISTYNLVKTWVTGTSAEMPAKYAWVRLKVVSGGPSSWYVVPIVVKPQPSP